MSATLLLAHADDHEPVLHGEVPLDSLSGEPRPGPVVPPPSYLYDPASDPNVLPDQRWGIVAPEGGAGDRLLSLVKPLLELRQAQQEHPVAVYRVRPGMNAREALAWKERVFRHESIPEADQPRYLLILGDLHEVSLELQQVMASDCLPGRLAFSGDDGALREEGFEAYVDKVRRWERLPSQEARPRMLFFTSRDGTAATLIGHEQLMRPLVRSCRDRHEVDDFPAREITAVESGQEGLDPLLTRAAEPGPSVLFTLSHGMGAPRRGWPSPAHQRALQGALCLEGRQQLEAGDLVGRPFLPGGLWFLVACFGAGTPARSAYHHWLHRLREAGNFAGRLDSVLASLPGSDGRPFVAALPQAALANPEGPLAVLGHIDLAWTYGFTDRNGRGRASRFLSLARTLVGGSRAGVGLGALGHFAREADHELISHYDSEELARQASLPLPDDPAYLGHLWMLRQDLSGYVLLGDPAVRLPLRSEAATHGDRPLRAGLAAAAGAELSRASRSGTPDGTWIHPERAEEAVLAILSGDVSPRSLAREHGVAISEIRKWESVYRAAGRKALQRVLRRGPRPRGK